MTDTSEALLRRLAAAVDNMDRCDIIEPGHFMYHAEVCDGVVRLVETDSEGHRWYGHYDQNVGFVREEDAGYRSDDD